jgi:hypothetical protein
MSVRTRGPTLVFVTTAVAACQHNVKTEFPPGLTPLEDNTIPAQSSGPYQETLKTEGHDNGDMLRVYGRGYVLAPPATVWQMAKNPQAVIALCTTDSQMVTPETDPAYELIFAVHYIVHDIVTIEWNDEWRFGTIEGTPDAPDLAMMKHQKTDGSSYITLSEGTIELASTPDPDVTDLAFIEHINAIGGGDSDLAGAMQRQFGAIVAFSHGMPLPACK